jgi:mRNA-degrading endonuclease RelE of RelBE toxin-antitoxin system
MSMLTVIETPEFIATAADIWSDEEREEFINWISANSEAGDVIQHTQGLRKVRWAASGRGKRGGARVIYVVRTKRGEVVLVTAYAKGKLDNIPAHLLRALAEKYDV